jgi:quinol monooxygenase YgiN
MRAALRDWRAATKATRHDYCLDERVINRAEDQMAKFALLVRLDVRVGKEAEIERLLRSALQSVAEQSRTPTRLALRMAPRIYGIFATFESEAEREAHLAGEVAATLTARSAELLERPPAVEKVEVLGSHYSPQT